MAPSASPPQDALSATQLEDLRQAACAAARTAAETFISARASCTIEVTKADGGFATGADLAIERHLRSLLEPTGIPVCGEELGGEGAATYWIVDPIDGTTNYATGSPHCAILIALISDGVPVVACTAMPLLGTMLSAVAGRPGVWNEGLGTHAGTKPLLGALAEEPAVPAAWADATLVGFGSIVSPADSRFPTVLRHRLLGDLSVTYPRLRITGSVGVDLALTALGVFDAAVTFSPHPWDNAAGVLLVQAAGKTATDLEGAPWRADCGMGIVAGRDDVHATIVDHIRALSAAGATDDSSSA
ncbi:inositol monophosphatase [Corynebacterium sp. 13CS0277]|uniref:inositol monophosphatase family protein n=1 Tax=Corynebacterium sp. 13CS0277 TaxID=2071994 RepID=UPI000D046511|nr:inositol monophosphatase family protein [Corynebacterium sp. 13CS0277]PRQ12514.1 inositol monophosphatase [Corynebacterium sp. 13CS0277]